MTHPTKKQRLAEIESKYFGILNSYGIDWLISELKASWKREQVMEKALQEYNYLFESDFNKSITAKKALAKVNEMK